MAVFDATTSEAPESILETLVGEGKKYKDTETLARSRVDADLHIKRIEEENARLKELADSRKTVEEMLAERQSRVTPTPETNQPAGTEATKAPNSDDLVELIRKVTAEEDQKTRETSNVDAVSKRLVELYGSEENARKFVQTKAAELEIPVSFLMDQAARSPKAFYATLGVAATPAKPSGPTHSDVNPAALSGASVGNAKEGTYKYYQEIRKSNPRAYEKLTLQMHSDAIRLGDAFYE